MSKFNKCYKVLGILTIFFCFSAVAIAAKQGAGLIYFDVDKERVGGVYYSSSKGDTKSDIWYSYEKILTALHGTRSQFYTAFDAAWPASTGTPYPGDRYLPIGNWFVPMVYEKPKSDIVVAEIETLLENNIGEINNTISFSAKTLLLSNNVTVNAIMTSISVLEEQSTAQKKSIGEIVTSVDGVSDRVDVLRRVFDEKLEQLRQDGNNNALLLNEQTGDFQVKLATARQTAEDVLQRSVDAQEALNAQLQQRDEQLRLQNKVINTNLSVLKNMQYVSRRFEIVILILLLIMVLINFGSFFIKKWEHF